MKEAFVDIVGNKGLCRRLGDDVLAGTLPHALILEGPAGTGKHTLARACAAALTCERKSDPSAPIPCKACPSCRKVLEGNSPDLIPVNRGEKATMGVDVIRFLREDVHLLPNDGDKKIYLIEEADKMTPEAQNAFLLTLEEPPAYVHFFLLCENAGAFLETVRSRAPILRTERLTTEQIDRYLCIHDPRAAQMKLAESKTYSELLVAAGGGIGRALALLEPAVWSPVAQTRALATDLLRAACRQEGARVLLPLLGRLSQKRDALRIQLLALSEGARDLILLKKSDDAPLSFFADRGEATELCDRVSIAFLYQLGDAVRQALDELARNAGIRLCLLRMAIRAELI